MTIGICWVGLMICDEFLEGMADSSRAFCLVVVVDDDGMRMRICCFSG